VTTTEYIAFGSNILCAILMGLQQYRHHRYREKVHAMLSDDGFAEGEVQMFIDETLRATAALELPEPSARDFAHALVKQEAFRKAVVHEVLHDIYIETHGRTL
jgi:hypothetical protein